MRIKTLNETKVLRDPVHEYIKITDEIIWNLIDTSEFQRLRRVHQLGGTYQVYHGAEHSRFSHSLGVYEIARRMIEEIKGLKDVLSYSEQIALKCAALLHDVGHGPFSHAFEHVTQVNHELMSERIILGDTQINRILKYYDPKLPATIVAIINHTHPRKLLTQLVSAQLDADRMDYLLRDSFFTGVSYGAYDLERILRTLRIVDDQVVVKQSGINAVEDYIMARYQMYWQVYFHPTSRAFEMMLTNIFKAIKDVYQQNPKFIETITPYFVGFVGSHETTLQEYLFLDEQTCIHGFKEFMQQTQYPVLAQLAQGIIDRDLFEYEDYSEEKYEFYRHQLLQEGVDPKYFLGYDEPIQRPYVPYRINKENSEIKILMKTGEITEITQVSSIVEALSEAKLKEDRKLFYKRKD